MRIITRLKNIISIFLCLTTFCMFFTNAEIIKSATLETINFCFSTLIPSLFPYMVLSSLFSQSNLVNQALSSILHPLFKVLGICRKYTSPIFFGNFCGFINGPKLLCKYFTPNHSKKTFNRLIIVSSNAGFSFVVLIVGVKIWGNMTYGLILYLFQIIVSFLINYSSNKSERDNDFEIKNSNFFTSFTNSITSSASTMFNVCFFTIFTSIILKIILNVFRIPDYSILHLLLGALLDVTQGVISSASNNNAFISSFFTGFSVGFGGLSILFQTFSICSEKGINIKKFILMKFIQGIICGVFSLIYTRAFSIEPIRLTSVFSSNLTILCLIFFFIATFFNFMLRSVDFFKNIIYNIIK